MKALQVLLGLLGMILFATLAYYVLPYLLMVGGAVLSLILLFSLFGLIWDFFFKEKKI